jgi:hypothetical protein
LGNHNAPIQHNTVLWHFALRLLAFEGASSFAETSSALARFAQHILSTAEHAIFTSDLNPSDPFAYSSQMSFNLSLSNMPQSAKADMRFLGPRIGRISFV